jgi:hypothetical protein
MKFYVKHDRFKIYQNLFVFLMINFIISALKENLTNRKKHKKLKQLKKKTQTAVEKKVQVQMTYFLLEFILE